MIKISGYNEEAEEGTDFRVPEKIDEAGMIQNMERMKENMKELNGTERG